MSSIDLVVPGDIDTPTGGYIYDREILAGLRALKWKTTVHALDASFPQPTPAATRAARSAAGVGCGKLASSECTAVRQPSVRRPARISRS